MYNKILINDDKLTFYLQSTYKFTKLAMSCNFYRQVKIFIKRIQNCPDIIVDKKQN